LTVGVDANAGNVPLIPNAVLPMLCPAWNGENGSAVAGSIRYMHDLILPVTESLHMSRMTDEPVGSGTMLVVAMALVGIAATMTAIMIFRM
jgi:hypothetical protein